MLTKEEYDSLWDYIAMSITDDCERSTVLSELNNYVEMTYEESKENEQN